MGNSKRISPLKRTAEVMIGDSDDLWVVPRYEKLHLINVLALQQQLSSLESRLIATCDCENHRDKGQECSSACIPDMDLLPELESTIKAYDEAILALAAIKKIASPTPLVLDGLQAEGRHKVGTNLTEMLERPRNDNEPARGEDTSQLLSIGSGPKSWFQGYVESHHRLGQLFEKPAAPGKSHNFTYIAASSVRNVEFAIVAACLCLVQLLPVMALTLVHSKTARLGIIIALIILVSLLNSLFAHTVQATNFGAVAAYSAIVVAFVSQGN